MYYLHYDCGFTCSVLNILRYTILLNILLPIQYTMCEKVCYQNNWIAYV